MTVASPRVILAARPTPQRRDDPDLTRRNFTPFKRGLLRQKLILFRELSSLLAGGKTLDQSLELIWEIVSEASLKPIVADLKERVRVGQSLAQAMSASPALFSPFDMALIRTGEESGSLAQTLRLLGEYIEKEESFLEYFREFLHTLGFKKQATATELLKLLGDSDDNYSAKKYSDELYQDKYFYFQNEEFKIDVFFGKEIVIVSIFTSSNNQDRIIKLFMEFSEL